jgi:hypothetical protein
VALMLNWEFLLERMGDIIIQISSSHTLFRKITGLVMILHGSLQTFSRVKSHCSQQSQR